MVAVEGSSIQVDLDMLAWSVGRRPLGIHQVNQVNSVTMAMQ